MENKEAKETLEDFITAKWFIKNFGGGKIEEAMKVAIKSLEK